MGLIEDFIARYVKEYDFYSQAGRLVAQTLETNLRAAGVRCIVTHRAKEISRLEEKCRQREHKRHYASVENIFNDIVDLAGVRVALYFPAERDQVDKLVTRLFHQLEPKNEFPDVTRTRRDKRFSGYSAVHYRVQLKEHELSEPDRRYAGARVEIQVASVLMHAWSEVEHDLVYKPLEGVLSEDEYATLDQLNGLVIAGEIALERLQKAGETRVADSERKFVNHYELAVHLLSRASTMSDGPVSDSGLGRVDLLFGLLVRLGIYTPGRLAPYLEALHGNLELRPLAEQVIDALLAEDGSRYEVYRSVRAEAHRPTVEQDLEDQDVYRQVGLFLTNWIELERLVRTLASAEGQSGRVMPLVRQLQHLKLLDPDMRREIDFLRRMRNSVVHGIELPAAGDLAEAIQQLNSIIAEIRRRDSTES
ncbi:MAG: GTP pyrophosphokinase [Pseudonocardiaceae bacterium]